MNRVKRSALLALPVKHVFDLVNDIERYPEFLPWCARAEVIDGNATERVAALTFKKGGMEQTFTTRNVALFPERIDMQLVEGPFDRLSGSWQFTAIRDAGTAVGCRVELDLSFQFSKRVVRGVFRSLFANATGSMVDAFCARAQELHRLGEGEGDTEAGTGS